MNAVPDFNRSSSLIPDYIERFNTAALARTKLYSSKPMDAAEHSMRLPIPEGIKDPKHLDWLANLIGHLLGMQKDIETFAAKIESTYKALDIAVPDPLQQAQRSMEVGMLKMYVEAGSMLERTCRENAKLQQVEKLIAEYAKIP